MLLIREERIFNDDLSTGDLYYASCNAILECGGVRGIRPFEKIASVVHIGSSNDVFQHSCPVIHLQRTSKIGTHRQGSINRRLCVKNIINHTWESSACV